MIKQFPKYLLSDLKKGDVKQYKGAKFLELEKTLNEWIVLYQVCVKMIGELIMEKENIL